MGKLEKIKVLHLVHRYAIGGAEVVIANLCKYSSEGIENIVCSFTEPNESFIKNNDNGQKVISLGKSSGNDFTIVNKLRTVIEENKIDIVHAQGWATYIEGLLATKFFAKKKCKFIFAFHGKTINDLQKGIPWRRRVAQKYAGIFSDRIITPSRAMASDYAETFNISKSKIQIIYNGIDIKKFSVKPENSKEKIGIGKDEFVVGFVGRLDPVKNVSGLIQSFYKFIQKIPRQYLDKTLLLIVGDGEEKEKLTTLVSKLGISGNVIFYGQTSEIPLCLAAMDVYVQPSLYEGQSNTIIEAMAASLPVISTNVGGTHEIIENEVDGLLFNPNDYLGIANAILRFYNNQLFKKQISENANRKSSSMFDVVNMVSGYEKLFHDILNEK